VRDYYELTERGRALRLRAVVDRALGAYDLDPMRVRLITNETNGVFRVDCADGGRYVVRVGLGGEVGHAPAVVAAELSWLEALHRETELKAARPHPTRDGERFVTVEAPGVPQPRNVVVFEWLAGPLLGDRLTVDNVRAYGAYAAALHRHGAAFSPLHGGALPRYDRVLPFEEHDYVAGVVADPEVPEPVRLRFAEARARVDEALGRLAAQTSMQVLHGDLHPWNVKVWRSGIAAFDFEDLMWGWPIQDVATTLYYFHGDPDYGRLRRAFEEGYRSVAPWPERRTGEIETFLIGRALVLANYVLAAPELRDRATYWIGRFDGRITALLDGTEYLVEEPSG
jgi:Ser/Thr protein kinase RdoA (MazF antagonist)